MTPYRSQLLDTLKIATLVCVLSCGPAYSQDVSADQLVGTWKFKLSWGGIVNDSGTISASKVGNAIEMTCTNGCNTSAFLRGTTQGDGQIAWDFWLETGVQSKCSEDKGWRSVIPIISPDRQRINFSYNLHVSVNCGQLLKGTPVKYALTRD